MLHTLKQGNKTITGNKKKEERVKKCSQEIEFEMRSRRLRRAKYALFFVADGTHEPGQWAEQASTRMLCPFSVRAL